MEKLSKLQAWVEQHKEEVMGTDGVHFCYALLDAFPEICSLYLSDKGNFISFYLDGTKIMINFNEKMVAK